MLLLPLVLLLIVGWIAIHVMQPFHGDGKGTLRVTIPRGATVSDIGKLLERRGVSESAWYFGLRARLSDHRSDLKAGKFFLRKDMSYGAAIDALTSNPIAPAVLKVTIPEGKSIRETAPIVSDIGIRGPYRRAAIPRTRSAVLTRLGAPARIRTLEGVLFPATYDMPPTGTSRQLVRKQLAAFDREFSPSRAQARRSCPGQKLSPYDVVIVASMGEREAELLHELVELRAQARADRSRAADDRAKAMGYRREDGGSASKSSAGMPKKG